MERPTSKMVSGVPECHLIAATSSPTASVRAIASASTTSQVRERCDPLPSWDLVWRTLCTPIFPAADGRGRRDRAGERAPLSFVVVHVLDVAHELVPERQCPSTRVGIGALRHPAEARSLPSEPPHETESSGGDGDRRRNAVATCRAGAVLVVGTLVHFSSYGSMGLQTCSPESP